MIKPSVPPLYGPFSATFGAQNVLSELESIGRSNLTWPAGHGVRTNGNNHRHCVRVSTNANYAHLFVYLGPVVQSA